jgi:metal-sulfur cluster biosynthetic enzyme|tara:strand:- start:15 stop:335 length:321 start_codon:yes stop_codon:yes gene_type:complete
MTDKNKMMEKIVNNLQEVYDPEMPSISVIHLGLIYDILIKDTNVEIVHTLTSAFCPMADEISENIKQAGLKDTGATECVVTCTFDPPFNMEMVPYETKLAMGWLHD